MKKFLVSALATFVLVSFGSVFAQTVTRAASHSVTVAIPEVVTIRFTNGNSRAPVTTNLDLAFQPTVDEASTGGTFEASNLASRGWTDVQVFQNRSTSWNVSVGLTGAATGFEWSQVVVTPSATNAIASVFDLGTPGTIAADTYANATDRGWNRLGFGPGDFDLTLTGTETAGTYSATVVYTLTAP